MCIDMCVDIRHQLRQMVRYLEIYCHISSLFVYLNLLLLIILPKQKIYEQKMISISAWLTLWMVSIHLHQQQISVYWAAAWPGTWVAALPSAGSLPPFTDILQIKTLLNRSMLIGLKITNSNPIRISNLHLFECSKQWYFAAKESTN